MAQKFTLVQDEPWIFLDVRKNPINGRKLTYRVEDGTVIEINVTMHEYGNVEAVKGKLRETLNAHAGVLGIESLE